VGELVDATGADPREVEVGRPGSNLDEVDDPTKPDAIDEVSQAPTRNGAQRHDTDPISQVAPSE